MCNLNVFCFEQILQQNQILKQIYVNKNQQLYQCMSHPKPGIVLFPKQLMSIHLVFFPSSLERPSGSSLGGTFIDVRERWSVSFIIVCLSKRALALFVQLRP